jgi:pre-mRNA-splicing factor CDC5/CEF1
MFVENTVLVEARHLNALRSAQTPLLGEDIPELANTQHGGTGYEGATPRRMPTATPNPLLTPLRGANGEATPARTPFRDEMGINMDDGRSTVAMTPKEGKQHLEEMRRRLRQDLSRLPAPKNDFEILLPEQKMEDVEAETEETEEVIDASELARRQREARLAEERARLARRSQAVQRDLPRPVVTESMLARWTSATEESTLTEVERLVVEEMRRLVCHDAVHHPMPGTKPSVVEDTLETLDDRWMARARQLVADEVNALRQQHPPEEMMEMYDKIREQVEAEEMASLSPADAVRRQQQLFEQTKRAMMNEASRAAKIEKKLGITLGGYRARVKGLSKQISDTCNELDDVGREFASFDMLRTAEIGNAARRVEVSDVVVVVVVWCTPTDDVVFSNWKKQWPNYNVVKQSFNNVMQHLWKNVMHVFSRLLRNSNVFSLV